MTKAFSVTYGCKNCCNQWTEDYKKGDKVWTHLDRTYCITGERLHPSEWGKSPRPIECPICGYKGDVAVLQRKPLITEGGRVNMGKQQPKTEELTMIVEIGDHKLGIKMCPTPEVLKDRASIQSIFHMAADSFALELGDLLGLPTEVDRVLAEYEEATGHKLGEGAE